MTDYNLASWFENGAIRPRIVTRTYVGQTLWFNRIQYEVEAVYPGFVLVIPKRKKIYINENSGEEMTVDIPHPQLTTFCLGDLVMNGYEPDLIYDCDKIKYSRQIGG